MIVQKLTYSEIIQTLGKKAQFTSDCEFFPFFNVIGIIQNIIFNGKEYIFEVKSNNKIIKIGSNMKNLTMKIIQ